MINLFSFFIFAHRESYNTKHVLFTLLKNGGKILDNNYFTGTVIINLSRTFDCILHDLVIATLTTYGFHKNILCYIY